MTKEEEAINSLEKLINIRKNKAGQIKYDNCICSTTDLETVLNMLKEKDAELKKYKKRNKELSNQILILYKEQDDYNARIDKKNKEIKKKDEELEIYKTIYNAIVLKNVGPEILSNEITRIEAQLEIVKE